MAIRNFIIDEHPATREILAPDRDRGLARRLFSLPDMDVLGTTGDGGEGPAPDRDRGLRQIKD